MQAVKLTKRETQLVVVEVDKENPNKYELRKYEGRKQVDKAVMVINESPIEEMKEVIEEFRSN